MGHDARMGDQLDNPLSGPPAPLPKRMNAVLRLFDAPLYRDWLFWFMLAWMAIAFLSDLTLSRSSGLPNWLVLQPHFVIDGASSLVMGLLGPVLMASAPV